jgi:cysteine desulfurase
MNVVARDAWLEAVEQFPGNPSSLHRIGARADKALEDARQVMGDLLGCSPLDVVWTSGATESNNTIWYHLSQTLPEDATVWVASIEHPCCLESARYWMGNRIVWIPVNEQGVVESSWLDSQIQNGRPHLVCVMAANNETGCLQPWESVRQWCAGQKVAFFCDAAQWVGRLPMRGLGKCDWVSGCAHKFGGPKGIGFLKCPSAGKLQSLLRGGPQEMQRRAGTENVAGAIAMVTALKAREEELTIEKLSELKNIQVTFESWLRTEMPDVRVLGDEVPKLWNTTTVVMPDTDCRMRWVVKLDKMGFAVSSGSACASGKEQTSHVMEAMGVTGAAASRVLRFSSGMKTSLEDWRALLDAVKQIQSISDEAKV